MNARAFGSQAFHTHASATAQTAQAEQPQTIVVERYENGAWVAHKLYLQPDGTYQPINTKENK